MKRAGAVAVMIFCAAGLLTASDWRGKNRLNGVVVESGSGKPVAKAVVKLRIQRGDDGAGPDTRTDNNGKWAILGLAAGGWDIDIEAPGYLPRQLSLRLSEGQRLPAIKAELEPEPVPEPQPEPAAAQEEVRISGQVVSKEIAEAVEAGNTALVANDYRKAIASYEMASAALPALVPLKLALARAYYGAGELKKAIASMNEVYSSDAANVQYALLLANMLLEDGQLERGKEIVEKLPADAITDPTPLINIGIVLMNKKQPAAAIDYFAKAIAVAPDSADGYYYRGLATIQIGKAKQAKADLEKVLELAPDSDMAKDAKEYLKSIK